MALDPSISLGVRGVQLNDPLDTYGKAVSLSNALARGRQDAQQAQINQEQLRGLKTKNDETDRALAEERNLDGILNEAKGDWTQARSLAVQRGISSKVVSQIDNKITEHATELAKQGEAEFKLAKEKNAFAYDALTSAAALENDPAAQKAEYEARTQEGVIKGLYKPSEIVPYQGPQSVRQMRNRFGVDKNIFDAAAEQRAAAKAVTDQAAAARAADKDVADLTLKNLEITGQKPIQPADAQRQADAEAQRKLTERGQNMTDARGRDLAAATREAAQQAREDKPPTSAQSTVASYAERIHQATRALDSLTQGTGERIYNKIAPNFFQTEKGQAFDQAERNFINAVLRRESGAVISPSEFTEARKQYIPQPGDEPAVLKLKAEARKTVKDSFIKAAGKAYTDPDAIPVETGGKRKPLSEIFK